MSMFWLMCGLKRPRALRMSLSFFAMFGRCEPHGLFSCAEKRCTRPVAQGAGTKCLDVCAVRLAANPATARPRPGSSKLQIAGHAAWAEDGIRVNAPSPPALIVNEQVARAEITSRRGAHSDGALGPAWREIVGRCAIAAWDAVRVS